MKSVHIYLLIISMTFFGCKESKSPLRVENQLNNPEQILALLDKSNFNGGFLIKHDGIQILHGALGYRDFESKDKLKKDHQFYLASISKQITAMACLILVDKKLLSLDDELASYFPALPYEDISIKQMLSHTSGIPDYYGLGIYKKGMKNSDVYLALLKDTKLDFEPGSQYKYSNSAYVLLSMIVAKVAGQTFKTFIHENIFTPLSMNNSVVFDETTESILVRAIGHTSEGERKDYHAYTTGGGGIFSTTGDLARWEEALFTEKLIPQSLLVQAYQATALSSGELSYYGFGWVIDKENPNKVSHTGSLEGFRNIMIRDLQKERLILLLTNNSNGELKELCKKIEEILDREILKLTRDK